MNAGEVEFYATAAHVIPILLLAYLVEMAAVAQRLSHWFEQVAAGTREVFVKQVGPHLGGGRLGGRLLSFYAYLFDSSRRSLRYGVLLPSLLVAAALPLAAEVCAFDALAQNRGSHAFLVIVWLGLVMAGLMVLVPALNAVVILYKPAAAGLLDAFRTISHLAPGASPGTREEGSESGAGPGGRRE